MTSQHKILTLACLTALVLFALVAIKWKKDAWRKQETRPIHLLPPEMRMEEVRSISITTKDYAVTLIQNEKEWCIRECGNAPANEQKVLLLLSDLSRAVITERLPDEPPASLGLDSGAIRITLNNAEGSPIAQFVFGHRILRRPPGGEGNLPDQMVSVARYILHDGHPAIVANPFLFLDYTANQWKK